MNVFLEANIIEDLRHIISNDHFLPISCCVKLKHNIICAVMDRVDTCIFYLNKNDKAPKNEHEVLVWFMYASILIDGIISARELTNEILRSLKMQNIHDIYFAKNDIIEAKRVGNIEPYKYFSEVYLKSELNNNDKYCVRDDEFFKYLRSIIMAHPFETSRVKFLKVSNLTQCSPFPIAANSMNVAAQVKGMIRVLIYTGDKSEAITLEIPFECLRKYIRSRYKQLNETTAAFQRISEKIKQKELERKIKRNEDPGVVLGEISDTLLRRRCSEDAATVLEWKLSLKTKFTVYESENKNNVEEYKKRIVEIIPELCDAVDQIDYNKLSILFDELVIKNLGKYVLENNDLGKITCYFKADKRTDPHYITGKSCAKNYYNNFAIKWVKIDFDKMSEKEIILLLNVACYVERKNSFD